MRPTHSPSPAAPRGFTLLELMVGSVITVTILMAVAAAFVGVQGAYQAEAQIKSSVEGLRTGMGFLEQRLRLAGYGVDPRFVFDFNATGLPGTTKSNHALTLAPGDLAYTDDLAFRFRDPAWMRRGRFASGTITLESGATFGTTFAGGQPFFVSCMGGREYLVVRAAASGVTGSLNSAAGFTVDTALSSTTTAAQCLGNTGESAPYVMLLHEVRVRIRVIEGRPFLVAYRGFAAPDTNPNFVPLAPDVESFQVAYLMNRPPPGSTLAAVDSASNPANWVLGDVGSDAVDRVPDPAASAPNYDTTYVDTENRRFSKHPANIRAVRLTIGVRSTNREQTTRRAFRRVALEDSAAEEAVAPDGFYRSNLTTTVRVPNMLSRSFFNPPVYTGGPNVWGG